MNRGRELPWGAGYERYHPQIWLHKPQIQLGLWFFRRGDYVKVSIVVFASY